jgi:hypothetical protein
MLTKCANRVRSSDCPLLKLILSLLVNYYPFGMYTTKRCILDEGILIKVCLYNKK